MLPIKHDVLEAPLTQTGTKIEMKKEEIS
jgi:hypothetical protein